MASYRFGKSPAVKDERTLMFKKYLGPGLAPAPPTFNSLDRLETTIGIRDVATLFPMDGNDRYGDCVLAAKAHLITNFHGLVGRTEIMPEADVIRYYLELSGGEDSGLVMLSTLRHWQRTGFGDHKIAAFVGLEEHDVEDVKNAIYLFGGVDLGFRVQDRAISDFEAGKVWTPGPTDGGGHCVVAIGYWEGGVILLTWGGLVRASWEWWYEMVDESYAVLPPEAREKGFAPGYDYAGLASDLVLIQG